LNVTDNDSELPPDLKEFIDRLIVPLLVEQFMRHLYSAEPSYYDGDEGSTQAA
jgi:hypothetical protein